VKRQALGVEEEAASGDQCAVGIGYLAVAGEALELMNRFPDVARRLCCSLGQ
jgi:hypothetical protein